MEDTSLEKKSQRSGHGGNVVSRKPFESNLGAPRRISHGGGMMGVKS